MWCTNSKDAAKKEAEKYGPSWRAEVSCNDDDDSNIPRWKPLEDWEAQYEPSSSAKKPAAAQSYMAAKAKQVLVSKIQKRITSKIMKITEETTSRVLSLGEKEAMTAAAGAAKKTKSSSSSPNNNNKAKKWEVFLSKMLNNINAIVLTYRFENHNPTKFQYLRRVASNTVADLLQEIFEKSDGNKNIDDMRSKVTSLLESQKDKVKQFVETTLDEALEEAITNAELRTAHKLAVAKKKLAATTAGGDIQKVVALDGVVESSPDDDADSDTLEEIEQLQSNIKKRKGEIKDETISMLADCIRLLVLKKMDKLTSLLVLAVNKLFDIVEKLYKDQKTTDLKNLDQAQLRDEVFGVVEMVHVDFASKVSLEVQRAVTVLEAMMDNDNGDDD